MSEQSCSSYSVAISIIGERMVKFVWGSALVLVAAGVLLVAGNEPSPAADRITSASTSDRRGQSPDMAATTGGTNHEHRGPGLSIHSIETHMRSERAQDFVIVFDGPVPDDQVGFVDDIGGVDVAHVLYTTQEWSPQEPTPLRVCAVTHGGFSPPATVGQVDVLMPADWFGAPPDADQIIWEQHPEGQGLKTPLCGPHQGYVQLAIWGPASHDPNDIRVYFDDPTRLVVEIRTDAANPSE